MTMKTLVVVAMLMLTVAAGGCGSSSGPIAPSATPTPAASPTATATPCQAAQTVFCVANPQVTQATIGSTICKRGWTATIRPPVSYTEPLKVRQMQAEGLTGSSSGYEEDHRLPLELGGDPRDPHNLSPEPHPSSYAKDRDENAFKAEVCSGKLTLGEAQQEFIAKWLGPYPAYRAAS